MTKLFNTEDLMFGRKGIFMRLLSKIALGLFGAPKANRAYDKLVNHPTLEGFDAMKDVLGVDCVVSDKSVSNIPKEGPTIVICNHPTGIVDGVLMLSIIASVRQDVKFLGNFLLQRIDLISPYLIPVNPFEERKGGNLAGLKEGLKHLSEGGCLLLFPAGEVSTWQKGFGHIADKKWDTAALKLMRKSGATIVPCWIDARNSLMFRLLGKIHPRLRTAMLCRETLNKSGQTYGMTIGSGITANRLKELEDLTAYGNYVRAMVDYLKDCRQERCCDEVAPQIDLVPVAEAEDTSLLVEEVAQLDDCKITDSGDHYSLYFAPSERIPHLLREIGRQREIAFRNVGEGSGKAIDVDRYDEYYRHLFLWDHEAKVLVGAYRMGFGKEIMPKYGLAGFYTHSLFAYDEALGDTLLHTMELGRSFLTAAYRRKPTMLLTLWKGIFTVFFDNKDHNHLLGPVTISGEYQRSSKTILKCWLEQHHYNHDFASKVHPRTGAEGIDAPIDAELMRGVDNIALVDKIISDIEQDERNVPVLVKRYLQLGASVVGFNVDHDFCDALDALMVFNSDTIPESMSQLLFRGEEQ